MQYFQFRQSELYAEDVPVRKIAEMVGTPVYIYSHQTILRHVNAYKDAFNGYPHTICFALKANSNISIIKLLGHQGCGADVVSGGELYLARRAGIPANKIVYAGVGKTDSEIAEALKAKILMFNVESSSELKSINSIAGSLGVKAPIALRVNPDIDPLTHPYISTGLKKNKFGIPIEDALECYRLAKKMANIDIVGIHKHIGSQITDISPFADALKRVIHLSSILRENGIEIRHIDMGGGLGIPYGSETPPEPDDLSKAIMHILKGSPFHLILEPGRSIVGNAGIVVTKVLYLKKHADKDFIIVDAGMNDLLRPSLYSAFHNIVPVKRSRRRKILADIVGPICESGDFLAKERVINQPRQGELLSVMSAGAYGFSMSSNYNSRPRSAEVMVKGKDFYVIREREGYRDLIKGTKIPEFLQ